MHPALLDACLHAAGLAGVDDGGGNRMPFSWGDVSVHAAGGVAVRVRLAPAGDGAVSVAVADATGAPVASVGSLAFRAVPAGQLDGAGRDNLFRLEWIPVRAAESAEPGSVVVVGSDQPGLAALLGPGTVTAADLASVPGVPATVVVPVAGSGAVVESVHGVTARVLGLVREWLAEERFAGSRLVLVTRGAVSGEDLAGAAVWGLVGSAQAEHPGRFALVDLGGGAVVVPPGALTAGEPRVLVRGGEVLAPRLARIERPAWGGAGWDGDGVVLITGGTGGLGAVVARHLAARHGVRHLVLVVAPGGPAAEGRGAGRRAGRPGCRGDGGGVCWRRPGRGARGGG